MSRLIWIEPPIRLLVVKQAIIRGGNRTLEEKKSATFFKVAPHTAANSLIPNSAAVPV